MSDDLISVSPEPIHPAVLVGHVSHPSAGGIVVFLGTVRDHSPGREGVTHLEYEAYAGRVEEVIAAILTETRQRWPVERAAAVHRTGDLAVGEVSVGVAVACAHRDDAFAAARHVIDELKARAPIWKKEHWPGGAEWVREGRQES